MKRITIKSIKEKLSELPYSRLVDVNHLSKHYKGLIDLTENICQNFNQVRIMVSADEIVWRYYTGNGKTFKEGLGKITIDPNGVPVHIDVLVPQLQAIVEFYGRKITIVNHEPEMA